MINGDLMGFNGIYWGYDGHIFTEIWYFCCANHTSKHGFSDDLALREYPGIQILVL